MDVLNQSDMLSHIVYESETSAGENLLENILRAQGENEDSFYIVRLTEIYAKHAKWSNLMSRVRPYYGVKYNPDPIVLRVMAQLDVGFYCGSPREIQSAFNMGVAPSRIVYSNPCKHRSFIKWAQENDIGLLIFDNEEELHKIKQGHPNAACILRIVAGGQNRANLSANEKYGANAVSARLLISISKNLGLNLKGICVHLEGTESSTRNVFGNVVQEVRQLFDYAQETFQISMDLITIEGNFLDQDDSLASVESLVEAYFPADAQPQVKIIAECAGYYVRSAITLCSTVIAKRKVTNHGLNISIMYYINAGRLGSLKIHRPQAQIARFANNKEDASDHIKSSIWGPTCAALDVVTTECYLPEMQIGERLVFPGMGIDSLTCASTFNGMPLTQSVYVVPNATFHCQQMAKCPPTSQDIERLVDRASENYFIHPMDPGMTERSLIVQTEIDISGATKTISCTQNYTDVPFFVVNLDDVSRKYFHWIQTFPRIMPFYAVKCNPDLVLLRLLADLGTGFDCASPHEIQTVLNMGVLPERIIYANPCKQQSYIAYARQNSVGLMTFDNEAELYKIKENFPEAKCVLRIVTDDTGAHFQLSEKFGANLEDSQELILLARHLQLNLCGISFHAGSGQMSATTFEKAISNTRTLFDYAKNLGLNLNLLDIGGGFSGSADFTAFDSLAVKVNAVLALHFPPNQFHNLQIVSEPGCYFASSAYTLCTTVIGKRTREKYGEPLIMYYINDGVFGSFKFLSRPRVAPELIEEKTGPNLRSEIWGPATSGLDMIVAKCDLPELLIGDLIVFRNAGDYSVGSAVPYNGMPVARERMVYLASFLWAERNKIFISDNFRQ